MSENNSNGRKVGSRIVRVGSVESSLSSHDSQARSGGRARAFGAPLQQSSRSQRSVIPANKVAFEQAMADVPVGSSSVPVIESRRNEKSEDVPLIDENTQNELASGLVWEQVPQFDLQPQENTPRWISNIFVSPSEEEYAALGSYIA